MEEWFHCDRKEVMPKVFGYHWRRKHGPSKENSLPILAAVFHGSNMDKVDSLKKGLLMAISE